MIVRFCNPFPIVFAGIGLQDRTGCKVPGDTVDREREYPIQEKKHPDRPGSIPKELD
jgi:hypothetical protein